MKVTVLSTPNCKNCNIVKQLLKAKKVEVSEVDLSTDLEVYTQLQSAGVKSMPVVAVATNEFSNIKSVIEAINAFIKKNVNLALTKLEVTINKFTGYTYFSLQ